MKVFVIILGMLALGQAYGQGKTLTPLKIGDKMPDVTIGEFRNYKTKTAKISDFKGKLLIIDFWNRWCTACIRAFPHMENLQEQFGDQIAILLVTDDPMEAFEKLHKQSPTIRTTKLPFVIGDSILHTLFPNKTVPYHVWIDHDGHVKAMTTGSNATTSHIQDMLDGNDVTLTTKRTQFDFDSTKPLIKEGNGRQLKHLEYYSLIMHRLPGYSKGGVGVLIDSVTGLIIGSKVYNQSIITLYKMAFGFGGEVGTGKVIVESNNIERFYPPDDIGKLSEWDVDNTFCYELLWPSYLLEHPLDVQMKKSKEMMRQDLDRFFQLKSKIETRQEKCLVLYRTTKEDRLKTKTVKASHGTSVEVNEKTRNNGFIFENVDFSVIPTRIRLANSGPEGLLLNDETNYQGNIDATLDCDFNDIELLKVELAKYGLGIKEETRAITCLVLRDE